MVLTLKAEAAAAAAASAAAAAAQMLAYETRLAQVLPRPRCLHAVLRPRPHRCCAPGPSRGWITSPGPADVYSHDPPAPAPPHPPLLHTASSPPDSRHASARPGDGGGGGGAG